MFTNRCGVGFITKDAEESLGLLVVSVIPGNVV